MQNHLHKSNNPSYRNLKVPPTLPNYKLLRVVKTQGQRCKEIHEQKQKQDKHRKIIFQASFYIRPWNILIAWNRVNQVGGNTGNTYSRGTLKPDSSKGSICL